MLVSLAQNFSSISYLNSTSSCSILGLMYRRLLPDVNLI